MSCHGAFQHPLAKSVIPGSNGKKSQEYNPNTHLLNPITAQFRRAGRGHYVLMLTVCIIFHQSRVSCGINVATVR
ncbi:hypothetical protein CQW29_14425 [Pantoea coffeiphila]|uniref:Uncharacterized protein n=1 Tax=Pantoea coffeiphila TaxID=1465635 RepID=A0A2S9IA96_9GAMM|nr:hypothetical protein CQW29_14425 [Pantoea coffeiphila]